MPFATVEDLATRLCVAFTDAQTAQAELVLDLASYAIADAVGQQPDWVDDVSPVPAVLRIVCLEAAARAIVNPNGVRSRQEQLGQYMLSESWAAATPAGVDLTVREETRVRQAVWGNDSGSAVLESLADIVWPPDTTDAAAS